MDLNALLIFAKVVEAGSFSEAARRLSMPVSTVSRRLADLENELGLRLLERSTRSLRLTETGMEILEHARRGAEVGETVSAIVSNRITDVSGLLRLSTPPSVSDTLVAPLVCEFQKAYPNVRVQVLVTERMVDHIAEGIDLVFRLGPMKDSSLVALKVLTYRHQLVASPSYVEQHERPHSPQDLLKHRLFAFSHGKAMNRWDFVHAESRKKETMSFLPHVSMNDYSGLSKALLAGGGIGDLPPVVQPELLRTGKLVEVMPQWRFQVFDLSIVHLGGRHIARPVRMFKELAARFAPSLFPNLPV